MIVAVGVVLAAAASEWHFAATAGLAVAVAVESQNFAAAVGPAVVAIHGEAVAGVELMS